MNRPRRHATRPQRGVALLVLMVLLAMGGTYMVLAGLNAASSRVVQDRASSGAALLQAKQALIAWVATNAAESAEDNPGRLPCPEPAGYYGTSNEGVAAGNCTLPAVGRLPWRTLGIDKLVDSAGEPLWYVVSPGWALSNSTTPPLTTYINSHSAGQITLDGQANVAVALVIAPGAAMNVQAATGCAARVQTRDKTVAPNYLDYLECDNASPADASFVTTGPAGSFNDQIVQLAAADLLPKLEAAIATRMQAQISPVLVAAADLMPGNGGNAIYPFAAPWPDPNHVAPPDWTPANSKYQGKDGELQGLLPLVRTQSCTDGTDLHCDTSFKATWKIGAGPVVTGNSSLWTVTWADGTQMTLTRSPTYTGSGIWSSVDCSASTESMISCAVVYGKICAAYPPTECSGTNVRPRYVAKLKVKNVATAFRTADLNQLTVQPYFYTLSSPTQNVIGTLQADGTLEVSTEWRAPVPAVPCTMSTCTPSYTATFVLQIPAATAFPDNAALQAALRTDPGTSWFVRNNWHQLAWYAVASGNMPGPCAGGSCLSVSGVDAGLASQPALLVLGGRSLAGAARPSGSLVDYLEDANVDRNASFERKAPTKTFNDRIVLVNPTSPP